MARGLASRLSDVRPTRCERQISYILTSTSIFLATDIMISSVLSACSSFWSIQTRTQFLRLYCSCSSTIPSNEATLAFKVSISASRFSSCFYRVSSRIVPSAAVTCGSWRAATKLLTNAKASSDIFTDLDVDGNTLGLVVGESSSRSRLRVESVR